MKLKVETVQKMPEQFINDMANMFHNGGDVYFKTFVDFLDYMYVNLMGGVKYNKFKVE